MVNDTGAAKTASPLEKEEFATFFPGKHLTDLVFYACEGKRKDARAIVARPLLPDPAHKSTHSKDIYRNHNDLIFYRALRKRKTQTASLSDPSAQL